MAHAHLESDSQQVAVDPNGVNITQLQHTVSRSHCVQLLQSFAAGSTIIISLPPSRALARNGSFNKIQMFRSACSVGVLGSIC